MVKLVKTKTRIKYFKRATKKRLALKDLFIEKSKVPSEIGKRHDEENVTEENMQIANKHLKRCVTSLGKWTLKPQ